MSAATGMPKRRRGNRMGEPRAQEDASSRDASEEDNDLFDVSDAASMLSVHAPQSISASSTAASSPKMAPPHALPSAVVPPSHQAPVVHPHPMASSVLPPLTRRALKDQRIRELGNEGSASEGLDSPTYDGDVESSSTIGGTPVHHAHHQGAHHVRRPSSPTPGALAPPFQTPAISPYGSQRVPTPKASRSNLLPTSPVSFPDHAAPSDVPVPPSQALAEPHRAQTQSLSAKPSSSSLGPPKMYTRPVELSEADIKAFVGRAIGGQGHEDGVDRWWRTNAPEEGKVVRVYADGVYDLFHFGHALQLRQAKLSFPRVHLMVGVCSDALCASHKSAPAMTHAERCESVRHCRWADEVLADAPWVVDQAWLDKHNIDYIAHDEEVYPTKDMEDVYAFAKKTGRFVPTRRTPSISTSDLLERIVRGYRDGFFDSKLEKNGHPELLAADVDWDSSGSVEKREKRIAAARKRREEKP